MYPNGLQYKGEFKDGERHGIGTLTYPEGDKWTGEWRDGKKLTGEGTVNFADGSKYVGGLREGIYHDQGIYTHANGFKYIGEFRNGTFVGQILSDGNPTFWGSFDEEWTYYDNDGLIKITNLDNNWLQ